jgi:hypothetical protein
MLAASLLAIGCARLSGEHDADDDDAQSARIERLLDDAPQSLKAKRSKESSRSADEVPTATSHGNVVSDTVGNSLGNVAESRAAASAGALDRPAVGASSPRSNRPASAVRPRGGRKTVPRSNVDEIPNAADVGL